MLNRIEEITNSISTEQTMSSLVILFIKPLQRTLGTMKAEMLTCLKRRYSDVEYNEPLLLATLLDPRFKDKFFNRSATSVRA